MQISAPGDGQRVETGWSGPVVVELSGWGPLHEGRLSVTCPSSGYEHQATFSAADGTVEVPVAPMTAPATDCTATADVERPVEESPGATDPVEPDEPGEPARVGFSAWHRVAFTDPRISPVFYPTVRDGYAETAELVFGLTAAAEVDLLVFDLAARRVVREESRPFASGRHTWAWDGTLSSRRREQSLPTGRYLLAAVTIDPVSGHSVAVMGQTEIAQRTVRRRVVRTIPAVHGDVALRGTCASGADEIVVMLVCRGTRASHAELSGVVRVPRDARLRRIGSHHHKPAADQRPGRIRHDLAPIAPRLSTLSVRIHGRRALVVEDLYAVWVRRVQQRGAVPAPGPEGIVAGEVTGGPGAWRIDLAGGG